MSVTVIVSFRVADFDNWKAVFDDDENNRERAGIAATAYKEMEDDNQDHVKGFRNNRSSGYKVLGTRLESMALRNLL